MNNDYEMSEEVRSLEQQLDCAAEYCRQFSLEIKRLKERVEELESQLSAVPAQPAISDEQIIDAIKAVGDDVRECNTGGFVLIDTIRSILLAKQPAQEPMKRYEFHWTMEDYRMKECDDGEYVLFEDYAKMLRSQAQQPAQEPATTRDEIFKIYCEDKDAGDWHRPQENYEAGYRKGLKDSQP